MAELQYIKSIIIDEFYCIKDAKIENLSDKKEIYFLGENGVGKTILLQSIVIASMKEEPVIPDFMLKYLDPDPSNETSRNSFSGNCVLGINAKLFGYGVSRFRPSDVSPDKLGFSTLFERESYLVHPIQWLKDVQLTEFKQDKKNNKNSVIRYDTVKKFLEEIINIDNPNDFTIEETDKSYVFKERGTELEFEQLADGYRSILIWLCDLMSRLVESQPTVTSLENFYGVVLVDEIDMLLHPKWEYKIVRKLRAKLPNIQWFISTHSPVSTLGASEDAVFYTLYKEDGKTKISEPQFDRNNLFDLGYNLKVKAVDDSKNVLQSRHISFEKSIALFSEVTINNYKQFKGLKLKNINHINLIAGLNNTGKSSLLEAIYLLCNQNDFDGYIEMQRIRAKYRKTTDIPLGYLKQHTPETIDLEGIINHNQTKLSIKKYDKIPEKNPQNYVISFGLESFVEKDYNGNGNNMEQLNTDVHLFGDTFLYRDNIFSYTKLRNLCNSDFYSPFSHQLTDKMVFAHSRNIDRKSYKKIITFIKEKVDCNIEDISLVEQYFEKRFKVDDSRFKNKIFDLTEFGDGMQRMFAIALQFAAVENGVLLIDELENAIDFRRLDEFAGFIIELSLLFNVQVFVTSHSKECINAFFEYDAIDKMACYMLNNNGVRYFSGYDYDELVHILDGDLRKVEGGQNNE